MQSIDALTEALPEALRAAGRDWLLSFAERHDQAMPSESLLRVAAVSEFAAATFIKQWDRYREQELDPLVPPAPPAVAEFCAAVAASEEEPDAVQRELRLFRNRYLSSIIAREALQPERFEATLRDWSAFASQVLAAAAAYSRRRIVRRFGELVSKDGTPPAFAVLGMGKLGGDELNFSSDIDLIFLYSRNGESTGKKAVSAETWFTRLSQQLVSLLDEVTGDGFVFRVDTRLRPFGDSGPPVTSFAALEDYLQKHGRTWERYAYIKASAVGPALSEGLRRELFDDLITPFVYRRYLDYGVFESLRKMHAMIAAEVQRRDLEHNLKLGPGGIREIEFIVQSLQLLRGGSRTDLASPSLLEVLPRLADSRMLSTADCAELLDAYRFLRRAENFVQAIRDRQTHELPDDERDRARLVLAMGESNWSGFLRRLDAVRETVSSQFAKLAFGAEKQAAKGGGKNGVYPVLWNGRASESDWRAVLPANATELAPLIVAFQSDPSTLKADAEASKRLEQLLPRLIERIAAGSAPRRTLKRTLAIVAAVTRRSAYLALLLENPQAMQRLLELCRESSYIAEELSRSPVLLDELLDPRVFGEGLSRAALLAELRERLARDGDAESGADPEAAVEVLVQFQRATMLRIAMADLNGQLDTMKVSDALTYLAETVLEVALSIAWEELTARFGKPCFETDGDSGEAGFAIVAYGKLGGLELSYGSDLDLVFLHDSHGKRQQTDGARPIDNAVFFVRLARRLIHFLTTRTRSGVLYEIDTRLRPSGRKGLLVSSLDAFRRYQAEEAWTWEHQALLRARAVAGSEPVAAAFAEIRSESLLTYANKASLKNEVRDMRLRMRRELDRSDAGHFDLKHGAGGLGDIEFIVQYLLLENAARKPGLIEFSDNIRQLDALAAGGFLETKVALRLQDLYRGFRQRQHRLSLNGESALVAAADLEDAVAEVRELWNRYFGSE
ncbi:MAG: bifunctional [glutamate--ammonia ligase]-adenylyl-L-tyrosine phosphorylase/[glutamate--ammonia-ligase] adenylyltransferase [Pseudomonadota bacterium]